MLINRLISSAIKVKLPKMSRPFLPLFLEGVVIKGFGRGSKELGCPTANYPLSVVKSLPEQIETGVYYGFAKIGEGPVYKMVANIGWCPFYQNKEMSIETHVIHYTGPDFYGDYLKIALVGYLRAEMNFDSVEKLIETINQDIANAIKFLDYPDAQKLVNHKFFFPSQLGEH
ncbi:putative riboflavin kinase [Amyelois transitella]|uniref:putative riboflavin kinase n=1 Tax=Amyelois transitella TaxID=680683 RepID=UPI00067C683E|nr:putative riboflavin kinase [Amyelois transitella]